MTHTLKTSYHLACLTMLCSLLLCSQLAMATENPKYNVTETDGNIELRTYAPKIVAETVVSARYDNAGSQGFRILADYIFGNNTSVDNTADSEKIAMTAPVIRSRKTEAVSEKIAMTAPVMQHPVKKNEASNNQDNDAAQWRIQFVMPSKYSMSTLPKPNNEKVIIKQLPEQRYAVIRFSGRAPQTKMSEKTDELMQWMQKKGLTPKGVPEQARYNPPWTPAFMRRNEVMVAY